MVQIISANRLTDGRIVYRDGAGHWTVDVTAAARFADKKALEPGLEAAKADMAVNLVVEIEAVELQGDGKTPVTMRDRIRVAGPSILETGASRINAGAPASSEQNDVSI